MTNPHGAAASAGVAARDTAGDTAGAATGPATSPSAMAYDVKAPLPHQSAALNALEAALRHGGRGQIVHACGAGKTRTAAMFAQMIGVRTALVLMPTLSLIRQTMPEWAHQFGGSLAFVAVCSEPAVQPDDLAFGGEGRVLGDVHDIAHFLAGRPGGGPRVVFATYDSSAKVAAAARVASRYTTDAPWVEFDLVVLDEAHRLAGADSCHKVALRDCEIPARRRVFMTATPKMTAAGHGADHGTLWSMDDKATFGRVLHRYTFGQAISDGRLSPYKVTALGVNEEQIAALHGMAPALTEKDFAAEMRHQAGIVAALSTMRQHRLTRMVSFHSSIARSDRFAGDLNMANALAGPDRRVKHLRALSIHSEKSAAERDRIMGMLAPHHDDPVLVSNPKVLTEGVDVPALDGIVMVDPRSSVIDTVQAVGRALRKPPGKTMGHIVVPILMRPDQSASDATRGNGFETFYQVCATLGDIDADFGAWVNGETRSWSAEALPSQVAIDLPPSLSIDTQRVLLTAKLRMVHQVTGADIDPAGHLYTCECCGSLDRVSLT